MSDDRTTDFEEWFSYEGPDDFDEAKQLHDAIVDEFDRGCFSIERTHRYMLVRKYGGYGLIIASDDAKVAFLQLLWQLYGEPSGRKSWGPLSRPDYEEL